MLGKSLMREVRAQGIDHSRARRAGRGARSNRASKTLVAEDGREFAGFDCRAVGDRPRRQCRGPRPGQGAASRSMTAIT